MKKTMVYIGVSVILAMLSLIGIPEARADEPPSWIQENEDCLTCHGQNMSLALPSGEDLNLRVEQSTISDSVHGQFQCTFCHYDIKGFPHYGDNANSLREQEVSQQVICTTCHTGESAEQMDSIHLQNGVSNFATCTDCHGVHDVQKVENTSFRVRSQEVCIDCHDNKELMTEYTVSPNVVNSYAEDFHGKTTLLLARDMTQKVSVAVCTDCHGAHYIPDVNAPDSKVSGENLATTCASCHPGATRQFASAWLSHQQPSTVSSPLVFAAGWFYKIMIPFILIGLLIHIGIDLKSSRRKKGD